MKQLLLLIFAIVSMSTFAQADRQEDSKERLQRDDMTGLNEGSFYYTHLKRGIITDERARWEGTWLPITTKVLYEKDEALLKIYFSDNMSTQKYVIKKLKIDFNLSGDGYLYYTGIYKGQVAMVITPREIRVAMPDGSAFKLFK